MTAVDDFRNALTEWDQVKARSVSFSVDSANLLLAAQGIANAAKPLLEAIDSAKPSPSGLLDALKQWASWYERSQSIEDAPYDDTLVVLAPYSTLLDEPVPVPGEVIEWGIEHPDGVVFPAREEYARQVDANKHLHGQRAVTRTCSGWTPIDPDGERAHR